ncbi:EF-P lysine aminoacylase GenX [Patescibacteria group bacterium]|nr:MAG: EF-P lysine aminoacylase GenX [Patescibacteria group bacterium]
MPKQEPKQYAYPARAARTATAAQAKRAVVKKVTVCGRVLSREERHGQALLVVADETGTVTCIAPPETPAQVNDIVECTGLVQAHRVQAEALRVLVPNRRAPTDASQWEQLVRAPEARAVLQKRAAVLAAIRAFFAKRGFTECDTPALVAAPGMEPYLTPFETTLIDVRGKKSPGYLVTSPEYSLKKLLTAGFERIYDVARVYRNGEEWGKTHNPEFLMLEWYRAYASYREIMDDVEELLRYVAKDVVGELVLPFQGATIDLTGVERMSVSEAFRQYAGMDPEALRDRDALFAAVRAKGYRPDEKERYEDLFFRVFLNEVEPCLGRRRPTIVYDYPAPLSALAKLKEGDPAFAERFEVYVGGLELSNGYTELNDPVEQRVRLVEERVLRKKLKKTQLPIDEDLLAALEVGMPPSGGTALGVDRLVMLMTDAADIDQVRFLPASTLFRGSGKN